VNALNYLMEKTSIYALWQAPFAQDKVRPLLRCNDVTRVRRVLDVGCGPGTNAGLFAGADYLGIDINPNYIESARRKHGRKFVVADVTTYDDGALGKFDFILINSFLHHLNDEDTHKILARVAQLLTDDGHAHILELVSPQDHSIAQFLIRADRGKHSRSIEGWRRIFDQHLNVIVFEAYSLNLLGMKLWNMVYCKGKAWK
jgi:SAM-dependent methyltransferase